MRSAFLYIKDLIVGFANYTVFTFPVKVWMLAAAVAAWVFWSSLVALIAYFI